MKTIRKTQKEFTYEGLGFPVVLEDVPMILVRGEWTPDINYNDLEKSMAVAVAFKQGRLTGNEVRFIRLHLGLTLDAFSEPFGVTRQAVMKWEKSGKNQTAMNPSTEKAIRLHLLAHSGDPSIAFGIVYGKVGEKQAERKGGNLRLPAKMISRTAAVQNLYCAS